MSAWRRVQVVGATALLVLAHRKQQQRGVRARQDDDVIGRLVEEARAEIGVLRDVVIRLAGSMMRKRGTVDSRLDQAETRDGEP